MSGSLEGAPVKRQPTITHDDGAERENNAMRVQKFLTTAALGAVLSTLAVPAVSAQTLVLGHGAAPGNPRTLAVEKMASLTKQYSDGELTLQTQGSEQLGSDLQMLQQLQTGALDLSANSQGALATMVPKANVFGLPFLFDSPEAAWQVVDGPIGDEVAKQAEKRGLKILAWWSNGFRQFTNNVRPIKLPEDMQGLKIRAPEDAMTISILKQLGANPTPMAFGELYVALKQGTVDGQENPLVNIVSSHLDEVQKYLSMADYKYEVTPVVIGLSTWNKLSEEEQQALSKAATEARAYERQTLVKQSKELLDQLKQEQGIKVNSVDTSAFREATQPVYTQWQDKLGDIVTQAQKAAQKANQQISAQ